jgi:hypothetical protein
MQYVTLVIAVIGFVLSIYTFITTRLARRPKLAIFRFAPERIVVDDDFDTLHVYTDADFIITNLSDKPNTVIRLDIAVEIGNGWLDGTVHGTRLAERTQTRTDYSGGDGTPRHHNEIVREWVGAEVCPIMLSPQASGIPNQDISLRLDFQNSGPITDAAILKLRLTLHDQYGDKHSFNVGESELPQLKADHYPKFHADEIELGKLKNHISDEDMAALVRVVLRDYEQDSSQSSLSVRRYYPQQGKRRLKNVAHMGRDGYAYNSFRPRDFQRRLRDQSEGTLELDQVDGFTIAFSVKNGLPDVLTIQLPETWDGEQLEIPIPEEFAKLCAAED